MSRIGKKPVAIPAGVKLEKSGDVLKVSGKKGNLEMKCHPAIDITIDESAKQVVVTNPEENNREKKALHGTMRSQIGRAHV